MFEARQSLQNMTEITTKIKTTRYVKVGLLRKPSVISDYESEDNPEEEPEEHQYDTETMALRESQH